MNYNRRGAGAMGIDELIGSSNELVTSGDMGVQELIGATARQLGLNHGEASRVVEQVMARNAAVVRDKVRGDLTRQYLPIPVTNVGAGATGSIDIQPQALFRTKRVMVPSTIAPNFRISEFRIGQAPQFAQAGSLPASIMSEVAVNADVNFDSADFGVIITIAPVNTSAGALDFEGALIGLSAR